MSVSEGSFLKHVTERNRNVIIFMPPTVVMIACIIKLMYSFKLYSADYRQDKHFHRHQCIRGLMSM